MGDEEYGYYYHHTDQSSLKKIAETEFIKQSEVNNGDAVFGDGTYLTTHGPDKSRSEVAKNNYDGITNQYWESKIEEGKTDAAVEFKLKNEDVQKCPAEDRDVYIYTGDLKFSDAEEVNLYHRNADGELKKYSWSPSTAKDDSQTDSWSIWSICNIL